jgi:hypothetical protein
VNTSGHFLTVNYSAVFDRGEALETFIFRIDGGQARLTRYDAGSRALLPG